MTFTQQLKSHGGGGQFQASTLIELYRWSPTRHPPPSPSFHPLPLSPSHIRQKTCSSSQVDDPSSPPALSSSRPLRADKLRPAARIYSRCLGSAAFGANLLATRKIAFCPAREPRRLLFYRMFLICNLFGIVQQNTSSI